MSKKFDWSKAKPVEEKIRKLAREGKVTMADATEIDRHPELVDKFFHEVLGIQAFLVTDASFLSDFLSGDDYPLVFAKCEKVFGVKIHDEIYRKPLHEVIAFIHREAKN